MRRLIRRETGELSEETATEEHRRRAKELRQPVGRLPYEPGKMPEHRAAHAQRVAEAEAKAAVEQAARVEAQADFHRQHVEFLKRAEVFVTHREREVGRLNYALTQAVDALDSELAEKLALQLAAAREVERKAKSLRDRLRRGDPLAVVGGAAQV